MIFKNSEIPNNFNKIAEISDNYIVWVSSSSLSNNIDYDAYIQFINPSFGLIFVENYRINKGTNYNITPNYINNGLYNYIADYDIDYSLTALEVDENFVSFDNTSRADYINIFIGQFFVVFCILWIFKQLSRLFSKGGLC